MTIKLIEYRTTPVFLSDEDLAHLLAMVKATPDEDGVRLLESLTPTRVKGVYDLRSGPFVGRLGLPSGAWLDLTSRFDFTDIIELIRRAARLPIRQDALRVPTDPADSLIDVIATALAREVERLVGAGLAKAYAKRRFEQPPYPGSIDPRRHLSRFGGRPDHLATVANRLSRDIAVNQALVAALQVLRRVPLGAEPATRLARLAPAFREVRSVPYSADAVAALGLTLLTARYADGLALAEIILRSQSLAPRLGSQIGATVVFSMPKIWETYVAQCVRAAWSDQCGVLHGYGFQLTPGGGLPAEADVIVRREGTITALYDAKYKSIDQAPSRSDVYQMVTYCERLSLNQATLVYPAGAPIKRSVRVGGRIIHVVGLNGPGQGAVQVGHLVPDAAIVATPPSAVLIGS